MRLRIDCFRKFLKMPVFWYDDPKNSPNKLLNKLEVDCREVNSLTSYYVAEIIQNISTITTGIIISFYFDWIISLINLLMIPLLLSSAVIQGKNLKAMN